MKQKQIKESGTISPNEIAQQRAAKTRKPTNVAAQTGRELAAALLFGCRPK